MTSEFRIEHDTMGEVRVPVDALYRAQTQRAVENFPISGSRLERSHIEALARIKKAAARANAELGVLEQDVADAIVAAADDVATGAHDGDFPIDVYQTGSGTSSNMNTNEVLATLATRRLGRDVHPNDHVNASQSSNDVFPTSVHVAATAGVVRDLDPRAGAPRRVAGGQVRRVGDGRQVRPHPPHGRHAGDARARSSAATRPRSGTASSGSSRRSPAPPRSRWAAPRSAPASTPRRASRSA